MNKALCLLGISCVIACSAEEFSATQPDSKDDARPHQTKDAGVDAAAKQPSIEAGIEDAGSEVDAEAGVEELFVFRKTDINHILITGQSNSVANSANPITLTQPYSNLSFNTGVMPMGTCGGEGCKVYQTPTSFIPLTEGDDFFYGGRVETASSGFANQVTHLVPDHVSLMSLHGRSGNTYWCLRKGGCNYKQGFISPFSQGMMEVDSAKAIAEASGKSYAVRAVAAIHGESDHYSYTAGVAEFPLPGTDGTPGKIKDYADALLEWQHDYETEIQSKTGQTESVPLFVSQVSGWNDAKTSRLAQMQLDAHKRSNGKVILVAPGYPFDFQSDCLHYSSHGQRRLGEYFAKAYKRTVLEGKAWEPVHPKHIAKLANQIWITYHVPSPPLVLDTQRISNPGNYGFEFSDDAGTHITNVSLKDETTLVITLSSIPSMNGRLMYAQNQIPRTCIGVQGARGNLRDSDTTPSNYGYEQFNWGVSFILPIL